MLRSMRDFFGGAGGGAANGDGIEPQVLGS
jgi:hypothetical protein